MGVLKVYQAAQCSVKALKGLFSAHVSKDSTCPTGSTCTTVRWARTSYNRHGLEQTHQAASRVAVARVRGASFSAGLRTTTLVNITSGVQRHPSEAATPRAS